MNKNVPITASVYTMIRALLGLYIMIHFLQLLPYGAEVFSSEGLFPAPLSPLLGYLPNPLLHFDSPMLVMILMVMGVLSGFLLMIGYHDRLASFYLILLLGWLYTRNPLIANPSLPVIGWVLLMHIMLPRGNYGAWDSRGEMQAWTQWYFPKQLWFAAWVLLAVAYSYSGYTKLMSPAWMDGSAIEVVLHNPLARDHTLNYLLQSLPRGLLQILTWTIMIIELLFLPLSLWEPSRKIVWSIMFLAQIGFLLSFDFADLTIPMILFHLLTFDRNWLRTSDKHEDAILFYDGSCAFCNSVVRFCLVEDSDKRLHYAPLGGETFTQKGVTPHQDETIIIHTKSHTLYKSDAAIYMLKSLGGLWFVLGQMMHFIPKVLRDFGYDLVGKIRYFLAGKVEKEACPILPKVYQERILF